MKCVDRLGADDIACTIARDSTLRDAVISETDFPPNIYPVDLSDQFCDASECGPRRDGFLIYRDGGHLTATYADHIAPVLLKRIVAAGVPGLGLAN